MINKTKQSVKNDHQSSNKKLFFGGVYSETTEKDIFDYFSKYGEVQLVKLVIDKDTNKSRRFGFVTMKDLASINKILNIQPHFILNKQIECKIAQPASGISSIKSMNETTPEKLGSANKLFIGGISKTIKERDLVEYFNRFGLINECFIKRSSNGISRGFGFIIFDSSDSIDKVFKIDQIKIKNCILDIKKAVPRENFIPDVANQNNEKIGNNGIFNEKLLFIGNDFYKKENIYFTETDNTCFDEEFSLDSKSSKDILGFVDDELSTSTDYDSFSMNFSMDVYAIKK